MRLWHLEVCGVCSPACLRHSSALAWRHSRRYSERQRSHCAYSLSVSAVAEHGVFGSMRRAASAAYASILATARATSATIGAISRLMWLSVSGPAIPAVLAILAIAALLIASWRPVSTFFKGVWQGIKDGAGEVSAAVSTLLDELGPVGDGIKASFKAVGDAWTWFVNLFGDQAEVGKGWGLRYSERHCCRYQQHYLGDPQMESHACHR